MKKLLLLTFFASLLLSCSREKSEELTTLESAINLHFVGREACRDCHLKQYQLFDGSDHDMAMDYATAETVLGDFDNHEFEHHGVASRFYQQDSAYFVFTEGADGSMHEFEIKYVFGIRPLQQYIVQFPNGRYQMLPLCWDTRPFEEGGQRWFHIYDQERIAPNDMLHWTRPAHNWNYMCSECHSTNVRKQYDYKTESYHTSWSEIDVSCEACHGPGSEHVSWAQAAEKGQKVTADGYLGLALRLKDSDNATWVLRDVEKGTAERTTPRSDRRLIDMCGRCHSRRSIISENYIYGKSLLDTHYPSLLQEALYFSDGQIQDEVYVYGSFLQSKMYTAGVVCSDCHEPHSGKVFIDGNALCYRCHAPSRFGVREHHFHDPQKSGGLCVECHMPERTYMVIDPRRDHSMRNPRPDLSDALGTPNACVRCHSDNSNAWAAGYTQKWYGAKSELHYGEIFHAARRHDPRVLSNLAALADSAEAAPMIRATALSYLENFQSDAAAPILKRAAGDVDPLIRAAAVVAVRNYSADVKEDILTSALSDSVLLVRTQAALALSNESNVGRSTRVQPVLAEYKQTQLINADHHTAWSNLAMLAVRENNLQQAEELYEKAIAIEPLFPFSYINLADVYRSQKRDDKGENVLRLGLKKNPEMADLHHALGLLMVRKKNLQQALVHLEKAARLAPEYARFSYVYGVALNSVGEEEKARTIFKEALLMHPQNVELLTASAMLLHDVGDFEGALRQTARLLDLYPDDKNFQQLHQQLSRLKSERH